MKISVTTTGLEATKSMLSGMERQVAYAASRALNATAKKVAEAMPAELSKALDRPTPFTRRGVRVLRYANKGRLEAVVGFMDAQAKYMRWQIEGGRRMPGSEGLRLPTAINLNEFGNIPKGSIAKLVAIARKERRSAKVAGRRIRVSKGVELFYGDPIDRNGRAMPRGIYKDVRAPSGHNVLIPLVVFPVVAASYRPRFDFRGKAVAVVGREWAKQFDEAIREAMR